MIPLSSLLQVLTLAAVAASQPTTIDDSLEAVAASQPTTIVDLSQPLVNAIALESEGAKAVAKAASADPLIRSAIVLENGKVVAEYYRNDVDKSKTYQAWSVTKSFTGLLVGLLVDEGKLSLDDTLGEIFNNDADWVGVDNETLDFRKNVTIRGMITHTSGLVTPPAQSVVAMKNILPLMNLTQIKTALSNAENYGGGLSLAGALNDLAKGTKGVFQIVGTSQILSYVVQKKSGMTPREYLQAKVMTHLGIADKDYGWKKTPGGVQFGFHGLELTARQMAKFGQLYLQEGKSKSGNQVISKSWVDVSTKKHVDNAQSEFFFTPDFGYGYLFWIPNPESFCAFGMLGQDVCIEKKSSRVIVQQRDLDPDNRNVSRQMNLGVNYVVGVVASNPQLSFDEPTKESGVPPGTFPGPLFAVPLLLSTILSMLVL